MAVETIEYAAWQLTVADVRKEIENGYASEESYNGTNFAMYDDGEIYPLDTDTLEAYNTGCAYFARHPNERENPQFCLSLSESAWKSGIGALWVGEED